MSASPRPLKKRKKGSRGTWATLATAVGKGHKKKDWNECVSGEMVKMAEHLLISDEKDWKGLSVCAVAIFKEGGELKAERHFYNWNRDKGGPLKDLKPAAKKK